MQYYGWMTETTIWFDRKFADDGSNIWVKFVRIINAVRWLVSSIAPAFLYGSFNFCTVAENHWLFTYILFIFWYPRRFPVPVRRFQNPLSFHVFKGAWEPWVGEDESRGEVSMFWHYAITDEQYHSGKVYTLNTTLIWSPVLLSTPFCTVQPKLCLSLC